jgi:hypothetical protein
MFPLSLLFCNIYFQDLLLPLRLRAQTSEQKIVEKVSF